MTFKLETAIHVYVLSLYLQFNDYYILLLFNSLPDSLGQIWKVQLWHNNAGASPNWYLSRVIVKDINTGKSLSYSNYFKKPSLGFHDLPDVYLVVLFLCN